MTDNHYGPNEFWNIINANNLNKDSLEDLDRFKSSGINYKISIWNPGTNGTRYLKSLVYNLCANLSEDNWRRIFNIRNREVGTPITVRYNNTDICMDYLQAVHEVEFVGKNLEVDGLSVMEIGGGYGRTCHAFLSNHNIRKYTLVDLDNALMLSSRYLKKVLTTECFSKLRFVPISEFNNKFDVDVDLAINIDSFAEMSASTVESYLKFINGNCNHFYVKNPVGKYFDKSLDNHSQGNEVVNLVLKTGILLDIIDVFDNEAIRQQVPKFIEGYRPGSKWTCINDSWAIPWSYYWQAFYTAS